jgi:hypothetical protein
VKGLNSKENIRMEIKLKEKLVGLLDNIFTNMKELSTLMKNSMEAV